MAKYNRILVKISGEALAGTKGFGLDEEAISRVAKELIEVAETGVQVAVVVGGGNFWRGRISKDMNRITADQIGMLATVMNAMALVDSIVQNGYPAALLSSVEIDKIVNRSDVFDADGFLYEGSIVVYGGGTGEPYFTTDTAAVLRACELECEAVFCAKAVDGIYDSDPKQNPNAQKYDDLTYDKVIADNLKAFDLTAIAMARENKLELVCFGKDEPKGLLRILNGEKLGTIIH